MGVCIVCGLPTEDRQTHHSGDCQREIWRQRDKKKRKARGKPLWKKERPCSECVTLFTPKTPRQETCGAEGCKRTRKMRLEKLRASGAYQKEEGRNAHNEYMMPDPWPGMDTLPPECRSWHQAEMMPVL